MNVRHPLMLVVCLLAAACGGSNTTDDGGGGIPGAGGSGASGGSGGTGGDGGTGGTGGAGCEGDGEACEVEDVCKVGVISCSSGAPVCEPRNAEDGTACGTNQVCDDGACVSCVEGSACEGAPLECKRAVWKCSGTESGGPECVNTNGNAADGTLCEGGVCDAGACVDGNTIVVEQGAGAEIPVNGAYELVLRLTDPQGQPIASRRIDVVATTGAIGGSGVTDAEGRARIQVRAGRAVGPSFFEASASMANATNIPYTTVRPAAGTLTTLVNGSFVRGGNPVDGPGWVAEIAVPYALTAASNGTIYFPDDNCRVYSLSPDGVLSRIAGMGCGYSGDGGPAKQAWIGSNTRGLVLDEANGHLYLSDMDNHVVRRIDLTSGIIDTIAGGGSATAPTYGSGGPALEASLGKPMHLDLHDGKLYIADSERFRIWRMDLATGRIDDFLNGDGVSCGVVGFAFYQCDTNTGCSLEFEPDGDVLVSGVYCDAGDTWVAIGRVTETGLEPVIIGSTTRRPDPESAFVKPPYMALHDDGQLYIADAIGAVIRGITPTGGLVEIAGIMVNPGSEGEGGPSTDAQVGFPGELFFIGDDLVFPDGTNHSIRTIWDAAGAYGP